MADYRYGYIGAMFVTLIGVTLPGKSLAAPGDLLFKLTAPDPQPGAGFGKVLSAFGDNILVGEPGRVFLPIDAPGRAYLFNSHTGALTVTFNNPEPNNLDGFANALTIGVGRAFVAANGLTDRIYAFDLTTGDAVQTISDPDGSGNNFAIALAYGDGDLIASSGYSSSIQTLGEGRAYLFTGSTGQLQHVIANPQPNAGDGFSSGQSTAVVGDKVIIGALLDDHPGSDDNPGRVWVFDRLSGDVVRTLENPNPESPIFDWFGWSVAANENFIAVGAREDGTSGVNGSGTAYVFDSNTGALLHTLFSPQPESNGEFGRSVAITPEGNILIGAWGTSVSGIEGAGRVYLFSGATGDLLLDIPNPEPTEFAQFGWSVAALDNRIIVGAYGGDSGAIPATGSVYVFASVPEPGVMHLFLLFIVWLLGLRSRFASSAALQLTRRNKSCIALHEFWLKHLRKPNPELIGDIGMHSRGGNPRLKRLNYELS